MSEESNGTKGQAYDLKAMQSLFRSRSAIASRLGLAFGGKRDYYETLGYIHNPDELDYFARYNRQDIASRINNAYPDETWRLSPMVWENEDEIDTPFEVAWARMVEQMRVYHYMHRLDRVVGLGRYGLMLLGYGDGKRLKDPVVPRETMPLQYIALYSEEHAEVESLDSERSSPRFGLPEIYRIDLSRSTRTTEENRDRVILTGVFETLVHHSRIIHVADGLLEDDVYGTPRLRPVLNLLDDLQKVVGGSAEAFWRNALRDMIATLQEGARLDESDEEKMSEHIDEFIHGMRRVLQLRGVDITSLEPEIASPRESADVLIEMISGTTGIPKRILLGSEMGQLASSQDESNWLSRVNQRQEQFATPVIMRQFIDRMIQMRTLPTPPDGYMVEWPNLFMEDGLQKAQRIDAMASALVKITGPGQVLSVFPLEEIRENVLEWDRVSAFETDEELANDEEAGDDEAEDIDT